MNISSALTTLLSITAFVPTVLYGNLKERNDSFNSQSPVPFFTLENGFPKEHAHDVSYSGDVYPQHYHWIKKISRLGDVIYTEDDCKWSVNPKDQWKLQYWKIGVDIVLITQNRSWFSNYQYVIMNTTDSSSIEVDLKVGPAHTGEYTRWVASLDLAEGTILLDDGSRWKVNEDDQNALLKAWEVSDPIIVGKNTEWFASQEHILINADTEDTHFVRANEE